MLVNDAADWGEKGKGIFDQILTVQVRIYKCLKKHNVK